MNKNAFLSQLQQAATALQKPPLVGKTLVLDAKAVKAADLAKSFLQQIATMQAASAARQTLTTAVITQKSGNAPARASLKALREYIGVMYGKTSELYQSLGFSVARPPAKPVSETRVAAVQQSRATRKARGTMGKKQRAKIKGVVQPQVSAPVASSPSAPSTAAAIAPSASSGNGANGTSR